MERVVVDVGENGAPRVRLAGDWRAVDGIPDTAKLNIRWPKGGAVGVDGGSLGQWDTTLIAFLLALTVAADAAGARLAYTNLPEGARRLTALATAVPERGGTGRGKTSLGLRGDLGQAMIDRWRNFEGGISFIGGAALAFGNFLRGRARFRRVDFMLTVEQCGAQALGIVGIISMLIGLILAFVGAVQLKQFGADMYVADLVVIAMTREMGAVMTAIVLAGRTGAAFAAQIGAMQANEEIDALTTLGIPPMEFLVLPRMLALILMTPLLCIYANLCGLIGGMIVGGAMLNVSLMGYILETQAAASFTDLFIGIAKSAVFGVIVAIAGCMQGVACGRSAAAVGKATTTAVVQGILWIVIIDGIFAVLLNRLGL